MKQISILLRVLMLIGFGATMFAPFPVFADANKTPSDAGEGVRGSLSQAQMRLSEISLAQAEVQQAQQNFAKQLEAELAKRAPAAHKRVVSGFTLAQNAVVEQNAAQFAIGRAQVWTALLAGSHEVVQNAIQQNDASTAQSWLPLREFRRATRFARPNADATLAIGNFVAGKLSALETQQAIDADLLDTYQARLNTALSDALAANKKGFAVRRAESVALAQGYFEILSKAFAAQNGAEKRDALHSKFAALTRSSLEKKFSETDVQRIEQELRGFRAAPLSETEQARRAGQMMRYIKLVPIEYGRGIRNGEVAVDLEIREAITFRDGANAAFDDLRSVFEKHNPQQTNHAALLFGELAQHLSVASEHQTPLSVSEFKAKCDTLISTLGVLIPTEWAKQDSAADFDVAGTALDQMEQAAAAGEYNLAESARIEAYAIIESGPEVKIAAFAPQFKAPIEGYFWYGHAGQAGLAKLIAEKASVSELKATRKKLDAELALAQEALKGSSTPTAVAINSGVIVFREGLEAVLILAALMASFKTAANKHLRKPMWLGTVLALAASVITWLIMRETISLFASFGEKLEAIVSLIAIAVLLLITNWFFHDVYWKGWMSNFHKHKQKIVKGNAKESAGENPFDQNASEKKTRWAWLSSQFVGLLVLGFTSVYREGFETALFLQALVLDSGAGIVILGALIGLALVFVIGAAIFVLQAKLPVMKMLKLTGGLIGFVLLVMVGKTVHTLQVVGWMPLNPIREIEFPYWFGIWFGTFATWEGLGLQLSAAVFVIGSYVLAEESRKRKLKSLSAKAALAK
jgi:high-affinity iron transporter